MVKKSILLLIGAGLILVVIGIAYFVIQTGSRQGEAFRGGGNFSIDEEKLNQTIDFFAGHPSTDDLRNYCEQNRMNCAYYCRQVDPQNGACEEFNRDRLMGNTTDGPSQEDWRRKRK